MVILLSPVILDQEEEDGMLVLHIEEGVEEVGPGRTREAPVVELHSGDKSINRGKVRLMEACLAARPAHTTSHFLQ